jgi:hypothetical protein
MGPESSLPHSQVHATCPYPEPDRLSPYPHIPLNIILPSMPGSSKWSLSLMFPHQNPVHASPLPIRSTHSAHLILLDLITRIIFGEQYRSLSSSLCSFLQWRTEGGFGVSNPPKFRSFNKVEPDCKLSGKCLVFLFQHPN